MLSRTAEIDQGWKSMRTPYIRHIVGEDAMTQVRGRRGWFSVSVTCSIAWPEQDVWLQYDGTEYILRGAKRPGDDKHPPVPCIRTPAPTHSDEELARHRIREASSTSTAITCPSSRTTKRARPWPSCVPEV